MRCIIICIYHSNAVLAIGLVYNVIWGYHEKSQNDTTFLWWWEWDFIRFDKGIHLINYNFTNVTFTLITLTANQERHWRYTIQASHSKWNKRLILFIDGNMRLDRVGKRNSCFPVHSPLALTCFTYHTNLVGHLCKVSNSFRHDPFVGNILRSIPEIAIKPVKGSTPKGGP